MASISTFHTPGIIILDISKSSFIGSILEAMFHDVPSSSKILEGYRKLTPSGAHPLNLKMKTIIVAANKPKKGEKGAKRGEEKSVDKEGPFGHVNIPKK